MMRWSWSGSWKMCCKCASLRDVGLGRWEGNLWLNSRPSQSPSSSPRPSDASDGSA